MDVSWTVALGGLIVGFVVGLTGMGGGALMTPMMILLFHVQPLAAVSSDLVASMVMKPVGGAVHLRKGTVNKEPKLARDRLGAGRVLWRAGAARRIGHAEATQSVVKVGAGVALLFAAGAMVAKALLDLHRGSRPGPRGLLGRHPRAAFPS